MADIAHKRTDDMIEELEKKIRSEYQTAAKEVESKMKKYLAKTEKEAEAQRALLQAGEITKKEYTDWMTRKYAMGARWEELRGNLAGDMANANKIAGSIANGYRADAYALNHNFAMYQAEHDGKCSTVYQLYDRQTVERLMEKDRDLMPPPGKRMAEKIRTGKVEKWNHQQLQSALTQSILQGEGIAETARRVARTVATRGYNDSVRYARTMMTGAENAGRNDGFKTAEDMGINLEKEWIATLDDRTRASHAALHGERVPVDETFSNGLEFPGDPSGDDEEVWNCRCSMKASVKGFEHDRVESSPKMGDMTFDEWLESRGARPAEDTGIPWHSDGLKKIMGTNYEAFAERVNRSATKALYEKWGDDARVTIQSGRGRYEGRHVYASYENREGRDKYSTLAHEFGHHFDSMAGRTTELAYGEIEALNAASKAAGGIRLFSPCASNSDEFIGALRKDMEALRAAVEDGSIRHLRASDSTVGVQDALDGFFRTRSTGLLLWGHGDRYYNWEYNNRIKRWGIEKEIKEALSGLGHDASNQTKAKLLLRQYEAASEAWANAASAVTCGGEELAAMEKYMPETVKAFKRIVKVLGDAK